MPVETCAVTNYPIEISGWDKDEDFFVERTNLEWTETRKVVRLHHSIPRGSLVFVRLIGESKECLSHPLAYETVDVKFQEQDHAYETLLTLMHPRTRSASEFAN
ncbi:MAG TPA: hypothetical protein VLV89_10605 [Candidatus Acidoferrum sp.]|nr:hypothetical protein [Candidatus Acidoferrum sp.]